MNIDSTNQPQNDPDRNVEFTRNDEHVPPPLFSSPSTTGLIGRHSHTTPSTNTNKTPQNHSNNETPIDHTNTTTHTSSLGHSISALDRLQRERREERATQNTREIDLWSIEPTSNHPISTLPPFDCGEDTTTTTHRAIGLQPAPRLRIRPKAPLPVNTTVQRVIIPSSGKEKNCEDLTDQFASPHSDRFVLRFPSAYSPAAAAGESKTNHDGDVYFLQGTEERLGGQTLEQHFTTAKQSRLTNQFHQPPSTPFSNPTVSYNPSPSTNEDFLFDPMTVPSPISTCGSKSPILGANSGANTAKKKLHLKPKRPKPFHPQHEGATVRSMSPTSSSSSNNSDGEQQECADALHYDMPPPPPFEFDTSAMMNWDRES